MWGRIQIRCRAAFCPAGAAQGPPGSQPLPQLPASHNSRWSRGPLQPWGGGGARLLCLASASWTFGTWLKRKSICRRQGVTWASYRVEGREADGPSSRSPSHHGPGMKTLELVLPGLLIRPLSSSSSFVYILTVTGPYVGWPTWDPVHGTGAQQLWGQSDSSAQGQLCLILADGVGAKVLTLCRHQFSYM